MLEHAASLLLQDPGLGKTSETLAAIKILKKAKLLSKVLIIAPLRVCHLVWPKERAKWSDFNELSMVVLHGPDKEKLLHTEVDIYVVNPEGLEWLFNVTKVKRTRRDGKVVTDVVVDRTRLKALGFDTLVIDELSRFKNHSSQRFKLMKQVIGTFARRWGLTGSPASNGLMGLFGQCYMLDEGRALGQFITHYRSRYFTQGFDGFTYQLNEGAEKQIYERLRPLALRMSAEDYLEMPTLVVNDIFVELPPEAREIYDALEDDLIAKIEQRIVTAATAGVASMKCRQVASGGVYLDQEVEALVKLPSKHREWLDLHQAKVDALADLVEELQGSPVLVAYDFAHDLSRLQARFGADVPYIGSGVSSKRAAELEQLWNQGKLTILLAHPQAIAHGLNLQEASHHVCWHTPTWDYELYDQFNRRVRRQGNTAERVFVHRILARDTVDERVAGLLASKETTQNALFKALSSRKKQ